MYMSSSRDIRVRLYMSRSIQADVNKPYMCFVVDLWEEEISKDLLRFGFLIFLVIWRIRFPSYFDKVVFDFNVFDLS